MTGALAAVQRRRGACARRWRGVGVGGGLMCVLGVRGGLLFGYVRAPCGPILKIHSLIHSRHRHVITSSAGPPVTHVHHAPGHAFCCMMSNMPVCAGGKRAAAAQSGAATELNLTVRRLQARIVQRNVRFVRDLRQDPQINHSRMQTSKSALAYSVM